MCTPNYPGLPPVLPYYVEYPIFIYTLTSHLHTYNNVLLNYFLGIKKWKREYNQSIIPESEFDNLKTSIEEFVHATDTKRQERDDKAEEEAEPNDDGWVTVSKKSRKKSTLGAGKSEKVRARMQARAAKRQKNKELRNFYKHASKENKLVKLQELRDKFEADKEKQKKLIADRKFRPAQNCVK